MDNEKDAIERGSGTKEEERYIRLLSFFRRYRRGCQQHPSNDWPEDVFEQWRADRSFYQETYNSKRHIDYGEAAVFAQEQLFIRCCER